MGKRSNGHPPASEIEKISNYLQGLIERTETNIWAMGVTLDNSSTTEDTETARTWVARYKRRLDAAKELLRILKG